MVKIRLRRVGAKKQPTYRLVVADSHAPRDGRFIETIGHYNPRTDPPTVVVHEDRALYWLSVGAQPSEPVARFFDRLGLADKLRQVHAGTAIADVAAPRPTAKGKKAARPAVAAVPEPVAEAIPEPVIETIAAPPVEAVVEAAVEPVAEAVAEAPVEAVAEAPVGAVVETIAEPAVAEVAEVAAAGVAPVAEAVGEALPAGVAAGEAVAGAAAGGLDELGLSPRVVKSLEAAGVGSADDLVKQLAEGDDALLAIPGIGAKAVEEIRQKLAEHGLGSAS